MIGRSLWRWTAWSGSPEIRARQTLGQRLLRRECGQTANLIAFSAIILLAFFFRTFRLAVVPAGLTWDEAAEGLDAAELFSRPFAVFFPANSGHEPAMAYAHAAALKTLGWSTFSMRLPNAFFTALAVAATFLLVRRLFGWRVAWLTAFLQSVTFWQIAINRFATRASMLILFGVLTVYWLDKWQRHESPYRSAALCGLTAGLALYVYTPARFLLVLLALVWLAAFLRSKNRPELVAQGAVMAGVIVLAFSPLGWYFLNHPDDFSGRAGQISIFNQAAGPFWLNLLQAIKVAFLMFAVDGEPGWDRDIAHQPLFDPVLAALFVAGVALAVSRWRRRGYALVGVWMLVMLTPMVVTSPGWPDFGRAIGIAPGVFVFPALAAALLWQRWPATTWLLGAGALSLAVVSYWQYFGIWANASGTQFSYRPAIFSAAQAATDRLLQPDAPPRVYFGTLEEHDTLTDFVVAGLDVTHPSLASRLLPYDARFTRVLPPAGSESYVISPDRPSIAALEGPPARNSDTFDGLIALDGYDLASSVQPAQQLTFRVWWQPQRTTSESVTLFAHLIDFSQRRVVASFDHNGFPTSAWRTGEKVLSSFPLQVPADAASGAYWLEFGAYGDRERRLHTRAGEDRLLFGPVVVGQPNAVRESPLGQVANTIELLPSTLGAAGSTLTVDLRWLPSQQLDRDYTVFVHVLDQRGALVAQSDGPPAAGGWPTRYWQPGFVVQDKHNISLPGGRASGQLTVTAGLYSADSGQRLPAAPAGPEPGSLRVGVISLEP